jgi:hypothetical protein
MILDLSGTGWYGKIIAIKSRTKAVAIIGGDSDLPENISRRSRDRHQDIGRKERTFRWNLE